MHLMIYLILCFYSICVWDNRASGLKLRSLESLRQPVDEDAVLEETHNESIGTSILENPKVQPPEVQPLASLVGLGIEAANERTSCFDIIHSFETATAHEGYLGKNWLDAFKSLLATSLQELHKDSDKDSVAALNTLGYSLQHSHTLDFETLSLLSTCSVDQDGRTLLMKLIHRGFIKSVQNSMLWSLFVPAENSDLIYTLDKNGNNILHLAVLSRSSAIVQQLISILDKRIEGGIKLYFDNTNKDGLKAIDLARQRGTPPEIYSRLIEFYRTHYFGGGAEGRRSIVVGKAELPLGR